jgi:RNA recognition motif-containing protein
MASHDPSRRLFLSGLPKDVTRKDIVEFVKKRTRANPMYIEIAKDADGNGRGFAHITVEGLRAVVEALNGVPMNGNRITAAQAKPHFSVPIMALKKEREDAEQAAAEARMNARMEAKEREKERKAREKEQLNSALEAESDDDDENPYAGVVKRRIDPVEVPPAKLFANKKLAFSQIAAEIASKSREQHKAAAAQYRGSANAGYFEDGSYEQQQSYGGGYGAGRGRGAGFGRGGRGGTGYNQGVGDKRDREEPAAASRVRFSSNAEPAQPPPPPPPPEPTKEAKKLANLHAKLAALKQKLGK